VWCKRMLEEGIAATIGPVAEPYIEAFPLPDLFFDILTDGHLTLAEAYLLSIPHLSWRMVLIGDPLYRPFKGRSGVRKWEGRKVRGDQGNRKIRKQESRKIR
jgi:hypothetical protein